MQRSEERELWNRPPSLERTTPNELLAIMDIDGDSPWFSGHFPGEPILPGVAILSMVFEAIAQQSKERGERIRLAAVKKIRFRRLIRPGERLEISASREKQGPPDSYSFRVSVGGEPAGSGIMLIESL